MDLHLYKGEWVQGESDLADLNLMLVFQVNCPGCLAHALPLLQVLADEYPDINCFALSTAFEDFALNTLENTQSLIAEGELTPASKRYFSRLGQFELPYRIEVPVVMDLFLSGDEISSLTVSFIKNIDQGSLSSKMSQQLRHQFNQRFLPVAMTGRTFLNNEMQGTPSWFVFDKKMNILESWFGHKEKEWVRARVQHSIDGLSLD
ncbi:hypothetical protein [Neptuniibacter sp.]|uniref:hypothetical protein n=1 Tax=Neptuniibacter sp. TaxID=1962643 RepID=UPI00262F6DEC|nr:hypothetical protein [Neptuniibacter sp.]MCP4595790.1 hypothetical protein [Neptuniibacter sp.]